VCGHIHHAEIRQIGDILYCNSGDWVESLTALVEAQDGTLSIVRWPEAGDLACGSRAPYRLGSIPSTITITITIQQRKLSCPVTADTLQDRAGASTPPRPSAAHHDRHRRLGAAK